MYACQLFKTGYAFQVHIKDSELPSQIPAHRYGKKHAAAASRRTADSQNTFSFFPDPFSFSQMIPCSGCPEDFLQDIICRLIFIYIGKIIILFLTETF